MWTICFPYRSSAAIFLTTLLLSTVPHAKASERWSHGVDKDQMTGEVTQYWAKSPGTANLVGGNVLLSVVSVRCVAGSKPMIYLAFGRSVQFDKNLGLVPARFKWDDGEVIRQPLGMLNDRLIYLVQDTEKWIEKLTIHNTVLVEIPVKRTKYPLYKFTLRGSSAAISYVLDNCEPLD